MQYNPGTEWDRGLMCLSPVPKISMEQINSLIADTYPFILGLKTRRLGIPRN